MDGEQTGSKKCRGKLRESGGGLGRLGKLKAKGREESQGKRRMRSLKGREG